MESNTDNKSSNINNKDIKVPFGMASPQHQGLITSQDLQYHYDTARFGPGQNAYTDTFCLWMAILHDAFVSAPLMHCVQEFSSSGRRRSAAKVYQVINNRPRVFLYVELQKPSFPHDERDDVAKQVTNHCLELLRSDSDMQNIVAGLCHGTEVAFWSVDRSTTHPKSLEFHDARSEGALGFQHHLDDIIQENAWYVIL